MLIISIRQYIRTEAHIYGSSRLGMDTKEEVLATVATSQAWNPFTNCVMYLHSTTTTAVARRTPSSPTIIERGNKRYELSNHLGNVLAVISDKLLPNATYDPNLLDDRSGTRNFLFTADVVSATDYYAFGMVMPGRTFEVAGAYRYGFNGKEKEDGINIDNYDFGARIYDGRVGRWLSVDPDNYEDQSCYVGFENSPIFKNDPDGKLADIVIKAKGNSSVTIKTTVIDIKVDITNVVDISFGGNYTLEGESLLSAALDLAGIIDPTGLADATNAALQVNNKDYFGAGISLLGMIPYLGDVAKVTKVAEDVKIISNAIDAVKDAEKAAELSRLEKRVQKLSKKNRDGKDVTPAGKKVTIEINKVKNDGINRCENCGVPTVKAEQGKTAVTPPKNQTEVDHVIPKSKSGSGNPDNTQVLCRECNNRKSNKPNPSTPKSP